MKFLVTTAIPYINSEPHIGFLWELLLADFYARYQRLLGFKVKFLTGTDENAIKVQKAAEEIGETTDSFVEKQAQQYLKLIETFKITNDDFIRTSSQRHHNFVKKFWTAISKDIYEDVYSGLYCVRCEDFFEESELENNHCPIHHLPVEVYKEKNYFFRLTKYLPQVQKLIEQEKILIIPTERRNEILSILRQGKIKDISISRSVARTKGWGISVPGNNEQVIYVWFDALLNYLTGSEENYWQSDDVEKIHIFGKEISKFHLIYWPAMLLASGYKMFNRAIIHGHILNEGKKMSKSLRNVISPDELISRYNLDVIRYYFFKHSQLSDDWSFSWDDLENVYVGELKNEIGNTISRLAGILKGRSEKFEIEAKIESSLKNYIYNFYYSKIAEKIIDENKNINNFIDQEKLWVKVSKEQTKRLAQYLTNLIFLLTPVMPESMNKVKNYFFLENKFVAPKEKIPPLF